MASVDIKVNLITKAAELQLQQLGRTAGTTSQQFTKFRGNIKGFGTDLSTSLRQGSLALGRFGTILRAGVLGGGLFALVSSVRKAAGEFAAFEKALIGLGKVTQIEGEELTRIGREFQKLSLTIPLSAKELLDLGTEAARLGVRGTKNLLAFTTTAAKLGEVTDVSGKDAVTALARILTITNESKDNVAGLGDALVKLGNNFAASESEILQGARVLAQRAGAFKLASRDILGIAGGLKSVGLASEISGSAIGKFFTDLTKASISGSKTFTEFAKISGLSTDELKKKLKEDAAGALEAFVQGLNRIKTNGGEVISALDSVGLKEKRTAAVFLTLSQSATNFSEALATSRNAVGDLDETSGKAFNSIIAKSKVLGNSFTAAFSNLGEGLAPAIKSGIDVLTEFFGVVSKTVTGLQELTKTQAEQTAEVQASLQGTQIVEAAYVKVTAKINSLTKSYERATAAVNGNREALFYYSGDQNKAAKDAERLKTKIDGLTQQQEFYQQRLEKRKQIEDELNKNRDIANQVDPAQDDGNLEKLKQNNIQSLELQQQFEEAKYQLGLVYGVASNEEQARQLEENQRVLNEKLNQEQIAAAFSLDTEKKRQDALYKIGIDQINKEKRLKEQQIQAERRFGQTRVDIASNIGALINAVAGKETKAGFLIQKAAAAASVVLSASQAIAASQAPPPLGLGPVLGAKLIPLIKANAGIQLATIAATAIQGFQDGGVVPGNSMSGDRVVARVNSGEMILNRQQQAQLFAQANGRTSGGGSQEVVVHTTVELDGAAVAKAVSRQVNNGTELGSLI